MDSCFFSQQMPLLSCNSPSIYGTDFSIFFFADIRVQLNEQLKSLDNRLEVQTGIVNEFQDIFRRKAEIELKYSQDLDKLAKTIKASKQK